MESRRTGRHRSETFKLSGAGTARKASIFPTELKGIPNLKLYCVANSTTLYKADGDPIDPLVAVKTNAATGAHRNRRHESHGL